MTTDGAGISRAQLDEPGRIRSGDTVAFVRLLAAGFVLRLVIAPWMAHGGDMETFIAWGTRLAEVGPANFWSGEYWCDYLPGYLLVLWLVGKVAAIAPDSWNILLFKLPNLLADVATAWMIWRLTRAKLGARHLWLPAAYLLSPAVLFNATVWGQADSLHAALLVAGLYLVTRRRVLLAGAVLGFALAVKPHTLVILPFVLLYAVHLDLRIRHIIIAVALALLAFAATFIPFAGTASPSALAGFIEQRIDTTMGEYGHASVNALNFWYLVGQNWQPDSAAVFLGLTVRQIGTVLCSAGILALLTFCWRFKKKGPFVIWLGAGLAYLVVFLFVTRAHERHVFPYFALLLIAIAWRPAAVIPWLVLTLTYCVNLFLAWRYILPGNQSVELCAPAIGRALCLVNIAVLPLTIIACTARVQAWFERLCAPDFASAPGLPTWSWATRHRRVVLLAILLVAGGARMTRLNAPPQRYFDEVYHAYTAEQWVAGNTDAWLWSEKSPDKGCSYEWTHPPLAKLLMAGSMRVFGVHPWAWRLPGALLGTLSVWLIYLLARALFRHDGIALLSAGFAAIDVLPLFASRIGMNDVYCVTFILLAVLLAVRDRWAFAAPLAIGVALACKWTALYALPLLVFIHLIRGMRRVDRLPLRITELAAVYVVMIPTVYLGSYLPFSQAGHTQSQFVELQKQMWWYHTGLDATHPFSSPAWQWPLLSKAVWCHTDRQEIRTATEDDAIRTATARERPNRAAPVRKRTNRTATVRERPDDEPRPDNPDPSTNAIPTNPILEIVNDQKPSARIANVYAWGNPIIWGAGLGAILFAVYHVLRYRDEAMLIVLAGYLAFWAPWLASPRIMFLYHYLPSLPFLYLALAWSMARTGMSRRAILTLLGIALTASLLIYPYVTAIYLPESLTPTGWSAR